MRFISRKIIKTLLTCALSERQIELLKKELFNIRNRTSDRAIRREIKPKIYKTCHDFTTKHENILQDASKKIIDFLKQRKVPGTDFDYLYSAKTKQPTLYASAYACMTLSLLDRLNSMPANKKFAWSQHFDSFQNEADGLFYDPVLDSELFMKADWWGKRHLALHMISAYTDLGEKPRYPFYFLEEYYDHSHIKNWLDRVDWPSVISHDNDIDNKIMNIGCLLQYQRDTWNDVQAGNAVTYLHQYLLEKINPETGMWGVYNPKDPNQCSRMVQFAYHLLSLFFYDHVQISNANKIVNLVLSTQNELGGFGVMLNSSACEDIDSIDILIRLSPLVPDCKVEIENALRKAIPWILCNQVDDGGFVFRLNEPFVFGHPEMASNRNQGAMLPTWFRTLSLSYLMNYLAFPNKFIVTRCPGYEF
ncbi:MAG: hypothetical protein KBG17_09755 [Paludibacteraceae bacterium]|jgi:hypothetical protein|nr:hypothetical protein [Paludibacteraceae bacterium]OQC18330.1 MAG: hypothetical protein BWX72_00087 [Firmicutes bacterium ADurb.Bin080]HOG20027.1 hypothetical protein [Salinivirgaceae bacterium]HOS46483.1 hypothetical protein [Paludibacter sp.]HPM11357.1 hypothetical protein [Paludibacter sp.]